MELQYISNTQITVQLVAATDNSGTDYLTPKVSFTNPDLLHAITAPLVPNPNHIYDWEIIDFNLTNINLKVKSRVDIEITIKIKE